MTMTKSKYVRHIVREFSGYEADPIWTERDNFSTYYDPKIDRQCSIPIPSKSLQELRKEF